MISMDVSPHTLPDFISGKIYNVFSHIPELISSQISLKPFLELNWGFFADKIQYMPTNMWKPTQIHAVNSVNYVL
jgi:hypothetical protein